MLRLQPAAIWCDHGPPRRPERKPRRHHAARKQEIPVARFHLAQVNIGRLRAPLDDPIMEGFRSQLDPINALADGSPGFVWRLQTEEGNATSIRPFDQERLEYLKEHGPSAYAFTFRTPFPSPDAQSGDVVSLDAAFCEWAT